MSDDIEAALEHLSVPVLVIDRDAVIRWQNRTSVALQGRHVGSDFIELVAPREHPAAREMIARILCRDDPADFALDTLDAEGKHVPLEFSSLPLPSSETAVAIFGLRGGAQAEGVRGAVP